VVKEVLEAQESSNKFLRKQESHNREKFMSGRALLK